MLMNEFFLSFLNSKKIPQKAFTKIKVENDMTRTEFTLCLQGKRKREKVSCSYKHAANRPQANPTQDNLLSAVYGVIMPTKL